MVTVELHVQGMSCAGCAQSIERRLLAIDGVQMAQVELTTGNADIIFDDTRTNLALLAKTIEALGFEVASPLGQTLS